MESKNKEKKKEKYVDSATKMLDAIDKVLNTIKNKNGSTLDKIKNQLSDAVNITYDASFPPGTYKVLDAIGNVIARAWQNPNNEEEIVIMKNEFSKRMN